MSSTRLTLSFAAFLLVVPMAMADPSDAPSGTVPDFAPDAQNLLFSKPEWADAPVGTTLTYTYSKKTEPVYGPSFDGKIVLKLEKGDDDASRVVDVSMFSGDHSKAAGPLKSSTQNPALLLALDANLEDIAKAWHANPGYLKDAIRGAWKEDAAVEPAVIAVAGKLVPGTRISIEPFRNDPHRADMKGLETMVYTVEITDSVPGTIAAVEIHAPLGGPATFSESLHYQTDQTSESAGSSSK